METAKEVAKDYPEIIFDEGNVDAMTMWLLKNPERYDVIVAPNLYGDIISDLCAQMVGGLGFACSGNIGKDLAVSNLLMVPHLNIPDYIKLIQLLQF